MGQDSRPWRRAYWDLWGAHSSFLCRCLRSHVWCPHIEHANPISSTFWYPLACIPRQLRAKGPSPTPTTLQLALERFHFDVHNCSRYATSIKSLKLSQQPPPAASYDSQSSRSCLTSRASQHTTSEFYFLVKKPFTATTLVSVNDCLGLTSDKDICYKLRINLFGIQMELAFIWIAPHIANNRVIDYPKMNILIPKFCHQS